MDQEGKYNRVESNKTRSSVYVKNLNLTITMRKTPTFKNILPSQYGSTVLQEYYCSLSRSHHLLTSQNKTLLKGFLTEVLQIFPNTNPEKDN